MGEWMTVEVEVEHGSRVVDDKAPPLKHDKPLYVGNRICAFAGRCIWALHETDQAHEFDLVSISLGEQRPAWLEVLNPACTVPIIAEAENRVVRGNSAILPEYISQRARAGIYPDDPMNAAMVRECIAKFDAEVLGSLYQLLRCKAQPGSVVFNTCQDLIEQRLLGIEELYSENPEGPYLLGMSFSAADIAIVSVLHRFQASLHHFRGYSVLQKFPALTACVAACQTRPAFKAVAPSTEEVIQFYLSDSKYHPDGDCEMLDNWVQKMLHASQRPP